MTTDINALFIEMGVPSENKELELFARQYFVLGAGRAIEALDEARMLPMKDYIAAKSALRESIILSLCTMNTRAVAEQPTNTLTIAPPATSLDEGIPL